MKNVNKILAAVLVLALCMSFAACGKKTPADETGEPSTETIGMGGAVGERGDYGEETNPVISLDPTAPTTTEPAATDGANTNDDPAGGDQNTDEPAPTEAPADPSDPHSITIEQFEAMTEEQQEAFADTFASFSDFVDWLRAARGQDTEDPIIIEDGTIDLGDYTP